VQGFFLFTQMIIPKYLRPGDVVAVVATAKSVNRAQTLQGIDILRSWGLEVRTGQHLFAKEGQFAGGDEQRAADMQLMIDSDQVKTIFVARGGYGTSRILDRLDFLPMLQSPKWICGFSDITVMQTHLFRLGMATMHAPMPAFFSSTDTRSLERFQTMLFGEHPPLEAPHHQLNRPGLASGPIIGGNLSLLCHSIGTSSELITEGNILFIEDVGEQLYQLDRMMVQLKRGGFLREIAALVVGQFTEMKDDDAFGKTANEIIFEHIRDYQFPVAFGFPIGHSAENHALVVGVDHQLKVNENQACLMLS
jgi:muramoyltetrapeptide carboxypeptidase